jgi:hypothetical protein
MPLRCDLFTQRVGPQVIYSQGGKPVCTNM